MILKEFLKQCKDHPVTIRLLDPPMHEFLPDKEELLVEVTKLQITAPDSEELKEKEYTFEKGQSISMR